MSRSSTNSRSATRSVERKTGSQNSASRTRSSAVPIMHHNEILANERKFIRLVKKYDSEIAFINHMERLKMLVRLGLNRSDSSVVRGATSEIDILCRKMSKIIARAENKRAGKKVLKKAKKAAKKAARKSTKSAKRSATRL